MMRHLRLPLAVDSTGKLGTVAQDSAEDVAQSLGVLLATREGERLAVPTYGTPDPLWEGPDLPATQAAVDHWEPRAGSVTLQLSGTPDAPTVNISAESEGG